MIKEFKVKNVETDILIIGGGAAGLFAGINGNENLNITIVDKGHIRRSGCLAAGINALNAYLDRDDLIDSYIDNIRDEFNGIIREDLAKTIGEGLKKVVQDIEKMGLTILKDENGGYVKRGKRSIKINGENIKEVLFNKVSKLKNIRVLNYVNIIDFIMEEERVIGAIGVSVKEEEIYIINARGTLIATGGASGIYKPEKKEEKHKTWYCPFNKGGGLGMGIRLGAEMTSFEIRFIALRVKDTVAPTGTIAQGIKGKMINNLNEKYEEKYLGGKTITRLYGAIEEKKNGKGPCFIETKGISKKVEEELYKAYLNMAPVQVLHWKGNNIDIKNENVEIDYTEPYIVGGHSVCGYYVDTKRRTSIKGLYAAGDVVGGVGKKYATGAFVEGIIGIKTIEEDIKEIKIKKVSRELKRSLIIKIKSAFKEGELEVNKLEEEMQEVMEEYCGGKRYNYGFTYEGLLKGQEKIRELLKQCQKARVKELYEFLFLRELIDRLYVALTLIEHMKFRKERRIRIYNENLSYPFEDEDYLCYINSIYKEGQVNIFKRKIVKRGEVLDYKNK